MKNKIVAIFLVLFLILIVPALAKVIHGDGTFIARGSGLATAQGSGAVTIMGQGNVSIDNTNDIDKQGFRCQNTGNQSWSCEGSGFLTATGNNVVVTFEGSGDIVAQGTGDVNFTGQGRWRKYT